MNKFEIIGIFASIGLMALALFLLRVDNTGINNQAIEENDQPALVFVASDGDDEALYKTLAESVDSDGNLEKLIIDDVTIGSGDEVTEGDTVTVHYIGTLPNGQEFDNSYTRGEPFTFTVGQNRVIEGWEMGIVGMQPGGQRILVIPSQMAYGSRGAGPIPPDATLLFTIELLSIE